MVKVTNKNTIVLKVVVIDFTFNNTAITCSKSTIETIEKGVKYVYEKRDSDVLVFSLLT